MEAEPQQNKDYQSLFLNIEAFYPHHVGYEIHSLPSDILEARGGGTTRAVQGGHIFTLEGSTMINESQKKSRACELTITDISTNEINYTPEDKRAYIGSVRISQTASITATAHLKPSIVRDVLNFFYHRPADENYTFKRAVIVRIDISLTPYGEGSNRRFNIFRIALE